MLRYPRADPIDELNEAVLWEKMPMMPPHNPADQNKATYKNAHVYAEMNMTLYIPLFQKRSSAHRSISKIFRKQTAYPISIQPQTHKYIYTKFFSLAKKELHTTKFE